MKDVLFPGRVPSDEEVLRLHVSVDEVLRVHVLDTADLKVNGFEIFWNFIYATLLRYTGLKISRLLEDL